MKKRIISFLLLLALLCSLSTVCAEETTQTMTPFISVTHDDGNASRITSTDATQPVSLGSKGYIRRQITVLDLSQINVPEGMMLDEVTYSLYCTVNFEVVDTTLGIYALDLSSIDFSATRLTQENVPENGELIASFAMPARQNDAEQYNQYMDFDLSAYVKAAIAEEKQYVGFAVVQTSRCQKGGMYVGTTYHENPPKVTFGFRERGVSVKSRSVLGETDGVQDMEKTVAPWISVTHDDGNEGRFTDTDIKQPISMGSKGYTRQQITVLDLSTLGIPEGTSLEEAVYSLYCRINFEAVDTVLGVYELDLSGVDLSDGLKYADVPARGNQIASFNMPARQGSESYNRYMDFDLTEYINAAIAAGKQYAGFAMIQTSRCSKGGMEVETIYGTNTPKLSLKYQEVVSGKAEQNTLSEGELEYNVTLLNETNETKQVRLMWAEVQGNVCTKVVAGEVVSLEANTEQTLTLTQAVTDTNSIVRFFAVEDIGTVIRPLINEKYELTKDGWK